MSWLGGKLVAPSDQDTPRRDTEFSVNVRQMTLHRSVTDSQIIRNL